MRKKFNNIVYDCFLGRVRKDARRTNMKLSGTKTSKCATTTRLVTTAMNGQKPSHAGIWPHAHLQDLTFGLPLALAAKNFNNIGYS